MVLLFITALSNALYAGQVEEGGTQGTNDESECDHTSVVNSL
jgi:hypothetical protein